jgi:dTDP-L-rhamnose 4-epimerase
MTILVTGAAGFIGSHLANSLYAKGHRVVGLDNFSPKVHENASMPKHLNEGIDLRNIDVTDVERVIQLFAEINFDRVFHLAAELDLNPDYFKFFHTNVTGTALLVEACLKTNQAPDIVLGSTQFVYGHGYWEDQNSGYRQFVKSRDETAGWDPNENGLKLKFKSFTEDQECYALNHYALTKKQQEETLLLLGRVNNIKVKICRYSIVHGPNQTLRNTYSGALRAFCFFAKTGREIPTYEDNQQLRDFTSIDDIVSGTIYVSEYGKEQEVYNVAGDNSYTVQQLAEIVFSHFGSSPIFSKNCEFRVGDIRHAISSNQKLKDLGWNPLNNWKQSIADYVDYFKLNVTDELENRFLKTQEEIRRNGQIKTT